MADLSDRKWDHIADDDSDDERAAAKARSVDENEPPPASPMDAKINGTPFSELMNQAVKLKSSQTAIDRRKFDSWPKFYQNSVYVKEDIQEARLKPFAERIVVAREYKATADAAFREGNLMEASLNYEYALGMFKHARNTDPNWRKKGIDDAVLVEVEYQPANSAERAQIAALSLSCYLNISRCYFKSAEFTTARQACDAALAIDAENDKALLLRARARVGPKSHGATELEQAIADLERALAVLEGKHACIELADDEAAADGGARAAEDLARRDKEVRAMLRRLKGDRTAQKKFDKQYGGMFERGEVYSRDEARSAHRDAKNDVFASHSMSRPEGRLEKEIADAEAVIHIHRREGNTAKAEELAAQLDDAKRKIAEQKAKGPQRMDFRNPTDEMKADARKKGIDLDDPRVVAMLEKLQDDTERNGGRAPTSDILEREARDDARARVVEAVDKMTLRETMRTLDELGVDHSACDDRAALRATLIEHMTSAALEALDDDDDDGAGGEARAKLAKLGTSGGQRGAPWLRKEMVWPITITLTSLLMVYRMHQLGLLGWLWKLAMGHEIAEDDLPLRANRKAAAAAAASRAAAGASPALFDDEGEYDGEYDEDHDEF